MTNAPVKKFSQSLEPFSLPDQARLVGFGVYENEHPCRLPILVNWAIQRCANEPNSSPRKAQFFSTFGRYFGKSGLYIVRTLSSLIFQKRCTMLHLDQEVHHAQTEHFTSEETRSLIRFSSDRYSSDDGNFPVETIPACQRERLGQGL